MDERNQSSSNNNNWTRNPEYAHAQYYAVYDVFTVLRVLINCMIMMIAMPSNLIVLHSISKISRSRQSTFTYISKHLCMSSLYIACVTMPINTLWQVTHAWYAASFGCKFFMALRVIGFYMTAFLIITLSINRYLIVKYQRSTYADSRIAMCVYLLWSISAVASIPQVFAFGLHQIGPGLQQCVLLHDDIDPQFGTYFNNRAYTVAHFTLCYALPVLVLLFVQVALLRALRQPAVQCDNELALDAGLHTTAAKGRWPVTRRCDTQNNSRLLLRARNMTLRTSATMLGFYVACWTPHYVMVFIKWFYPEIEDITPTFLNWALLTCAMMNCCFTPLVYGFMVPTIRDMITRSVLGSWSARIASLGHII